MKIRGRVLVLAVSMPVIAFAVVGGFMSKAIAREDSYQYLRIFEDVVSLIDGAGDVTTVDAGSPTPPKQGRYTLPAPVTIRIPTDDTAGERRVTVQQIRY